KLKFPEAVVVVCEKRVAGIQRLCEEHPEVDLVVMDDGFQHRYVEPKINIVMIDATRPVQCDKMLPQGTLRDLPEMLHRAHYFVVTKCPENMAPIDRRILHKVLIQVAYQQIYYTRFESFMPKAIFADEATKAFAPKQQVIALSGIGNPKPFLDTLRETYNLVEELTLEDHHVYKVRDMRQIESMLELHPKAVVVTTEKDAVKLMNRDKVPATIRRKLYYIPVNISFIEDSATDLLQKLEQDVRGN
ncbi:MAG: tetraacyldisaccharide 4'-kinase, partial [Alistipes sp.]